ncbi:MAG: nucleotide exchange factor GrpE [archaeon]|nr:nucleotide exchange factor GrpE [archaeon]
MSSLNQQEPEENGGESPKNEGETSSDELNELKELLQRTQANFENYRKQTEKRVEEMIQIATKGIIAQILPILDNFELALQTAETSSEQPEFVQGITLIHSQLTKTLKDNGVKEIKVEGTFDPHIHEALMKMPSELPENSIVGIIQKGYTLHGKLLRPARVTLSAGQIKSTDEQNKTKNKN